MSTINNRSSINVRYMPLDRYEYLIEIELNTTDVTVIDRLRNILGNRSYSVGFNIQLTEINISTVCYPNSTGFQCRCEEQYRWPCAKCLLYHSCDVITNDTCGCIDALPTDGQYCQSVYQQNFTACLPSTTGPPSTFHNYFTICLSTVPLVRYEYLIEIELNTTDVTVIDRLRNILGNRSYSVGFNIQLTEINISTVCYPNSTGFQCRCEEQYRWPCAKCLLYHSCDVITNDTCGCIDALPTDGQYCQSVYQQNFTACLPSTTGPPSTTVPLVRYEYLIEIELNTTDVTVIDRLRNIIGNRSFSVGFNIQLTEINISTVCYPNSTGFQCRCEEQYRWPCAKCLRYHSCDVITNDTCGCIDALPTDGQYCQSVYQQNFTACLPSTTGPPSTSVPLVRYEYLIEIELNTTDVTVIDRLRNILGNRSYSVGFNIQLTEINISTVCYPNSTGFQCRCEEQYRWPCEKCLRYHSCDVITNDTCGCIDALPTDGQYCQSVYQQTVPLVRYEYLIEIELNTTDVTVIDRLRNILGNRSYSVEVNLQLTEINISTVCYPNTTGFQCRCEEQYRWPCAKCLRYHSCDVITNDTCGCIDALPTDGQYCQSVYQQTVPLVRYEYLIEIELNTTDVTVIDRLRNILGNRSYSVEVDLQLTEINISTVCYPNTTGFQCRCEEQYRWPCAKCLRYHSCDVITNDTCGCIDALPTDGQYCQSVYQQMPLVRYEYLIEIELNTTDVTVIDRLRNILGNRSYSVEVDLQLTEINISTVCYPNTTGFQCRCEEQYRWPCAKCLRCSKHYYTQHYYTPLYSKHHNSCCKHYYCFHYSKHHYSCSKHYNTRHHYTQHYYTPHYSKHHYSCSKHYCCFHYSKHHYSCSKHYCCFHYSKHHYSCSKHYNTRHHYTQHYYTPHYSKHHYSCSKHYCCFHYSKHHYSCSKHYCCFHYSKHHYSCSKHYNTRHHYTQHYYTPHYSKHHYSCSKHYYTPHYSKHHYSCSKHYCCFHYSKHHYSCSKHYNTRHHYTQHYYTPHYSKHHYSCSKHYNTRHHYTQHYYTPHYSKHHYSCSKHYCCFHYSKHHYSCSKHYCCFHYSKHYYCFHYSKHYYCFHYSKHYYCFHYSKHNCCFHYSKHYYCFHYSKHYYCFHYSKHYYCFHYSKHYYCFHYSKHYYCFHYSKHYYYLIILERTTFNNTKILNSSVTLTIPIRNVTVTTMTFSTLRNILPLRTSSLNVTDNSSIKDTVNGLIVLIKVKDPETSVNLVFKKLNVSLTQAPRCVFWNSSLLRGLGAWDDAGCVVQSDGKGDSVTCQCDHLTSFSILMSTSVPVDKNTVELLDRITYAGVGISMASLVICLVIEALVWKAMTRNSTSYMRHVSIVNIAVSLLIADIWFLIGAAISKTPSENPFEDQKVPVPGCTAATFFVHFFYLALFFWMLVSGLLLFYRTVLVFSHMSKSTMLAIGFSLGYGGPLLIAVVTIASTAGGGGYLQEFNGCWLNWDKTKALLAFVIPALTIVLINFLILIVVLYKMLRRGVGDSAQADEKNAVVVIARCLAILTPFFGLTWALGVGTIVDSGNIAIHIAFAFFNSLQVNIFSDLYV
ncbi:uncharacterized protein FYW47_007279 [Aplochiton taeniatus]